MKKLIVYGSKGDGTLNPKPIFEVEAPEGTELENLRCEISHRHEAIAEINVVWEEIPVGRIY